MGFEGLVDTWENVNQPGEYRAEEPTLTAMMGMWESRLSRPEDMEIKLEAQVSLERGKVTTL